MPQEDPRRRASLPVPGYRPFLIDPADSTRFAQALEMIAEGGGDPEQYQRLADIAYVSGYDGPQTQGEWDRNRARLLRDHLLSDPETSVGPPEPPEGRFASALQENGQERPQSANEDGLDAYRAYMAKKGRAQGAPRDQGLTAYQLYKEGKRVRDLGVYPELRIPDVPPGVPSPAGPQRDVAEARPPAGGGEPMGPPVPTEMGPPKPTEIQAPEPQTSGGAESPFTAANRGRATDLVGFLKGLAGVTERTWVENDLSREDREYVRRIQANRETLGLPPLSTDDLRFIISRKQGEDAEAYLRAQEPGVSQGEDPWGPLKLPPDLAAIHRRARMGDPDAKAEWQKLTATPEAVEQLRYQAYRQPGGAWLGDVNALERLPYGMAEMGVASIESGARFFQGRAGNVGREGLPADVQAQAWFDQVADWAGAKREDFYVPTKTLRELSQGGSVGDWVDWGMSSLGRGIGSTGPAILAGMATGGAGAGAIAPMFVTSFLQNYGEMVDALENAGVDEDEALGKAVLWTVPVAMLDVVGAQHVGMAAGLLTGVRREATRDLSRAISTTAIQRVSKGLAEGVLAEGPTEGLQEVINWIAAYREGHPDATREDIAWAVAEAAAQGALTGGAMGGGGAAWSGGPREQLEVQRRAEENRDIGFVPGTGALWERRVGLPGENRYRRAGEEAPQPSEVEVEAPGVEGRLLVPREGKVPDAEFVGVPSLEGFEPSDFELADEPPPTDRRRSREEVEQVLLDLARNNPDAVLAPDFFAGPMQIEGGGFSKGIPPEAMPAIEQRINELESKAGLEESGAKWRRNKEGGWELATSALNDAEQKELAALHWLRNNPIGIPDLRRAGEIDESTTEGRTAVSRAREGQTPFPEGEQTAAPEAQEAPTSETVPTTPVTRPRPAPAPQAPEEPVAWDETPVVGRDAAQYEPPPAGQVPNYPNLPVYEAKVEDLEERPDVFQYRVVGSRAQGMGIPDEVQYDPGAVGTLSVWKDTEGEIGEPGKIYVVNGHNRLSKMRRSGVGTANVVFLNDKGITTAEEARQQGALQNIRDDEARGVQTAEAVLNAAVFMRESGLTLEEVMGQFGYKREGVFRTAASIAQLPQGIYDDWASQTDRTFVGNDAVYAAIGQAGLTEPQALAVWNAIKGRRNPPSAESLQEAIEHARSSVEVGSSDQLGMFGEADFVDFLREIGDIYAHINKQIASLKKMSATALRNAEGYQAAGIIEQEIDKKRAAEVGEEAAQMLRAWEVMRRQNPELRKKVEAYAKRLKKAKRGNRAKVLEEAWNEINATYLQESGAGEAAGAAQDRGGRGETGQEQPAPGTVEEAAADYTTEEVEEAEEAVATTGDESDVYRDRFRIYVKSNEPKVWGLYDMETGTETEHRRKKRAKEYANQILDSTPEAQRAEARTPEQERLPSGRGVFEEGAGQGAAVAALPPAQTTDQKANAILIRELEAEEAELTDMLENDIPDIINESGLRGSQIRVGRQQSHLSKLKVPQLWELLKNIENKIAAQRQALRNAALGGTGPVSSPLDLRSSVRDALDVRRRIAEMEGYNPNARPEKSAPEIVVEAEPEAAPETAGAVEAAPEVTGVLEEEQAAEVASNKPPWVQQAESWFARILNRIQNRTPRPFEEEYQERQLEVALLFRNLARLHVMAQGEGRFARDVANHQEQAESIWDLVFQIHEDFTDVLDEFRAQLRADPRKYATLFAQLFDQGAAAIGGRTASILKRLSFAPTTYWPNVREGSRPRKGRVRTAPTGQKFDYDSRQVAFGKSGAPKTVSQWIQRWDDLFRSPNGKYRSGAWLSKHPERVDEGIKLLTYLAEVLTETDFQMSYGEARDVARLLEDPLSPISKLLFDKPPKPRHGSSWSKVADTSNVRHGVSWVRDESHPAIRAHSLVLGRVGELDGVYRNWLLNPEFGEDKTRSPGQRFLKVDPNELPQQEGPSGPPATTGSQPDLFGELDPAVRAVLDEAGKQMGLDLFTQGQAVEQRQQGAREKARRFVERHYDAWWNSRAQGYAGPLSLEDKKKMLEALKYFNEGLTYKNQNDIWLLQIEVEQAERARVKQRQRPYGGDRAFAYEGSAAEVMEEAIPEEELRTDDVLPDVAEYDTDPTAAKEADERITKNKLRWTWRKRRIWTPQDVINALEAAFEVPINTGKTRFGRFTYGVFKVWPRAIRAKFKQDLEAVGHELGHALNYLLFGNQAYTKSGNLSNIPLTPWANELLPLAQGISDGDLVEGVAEFYRRWLNNPESARTKAPVFYAWFENTMEKNHPVMWEGIKATRREYELYRNVGAVGRILSQFGYEPQKHSLLPPLTRLYRRALDHWYPVEWVEKRIMGEIDPRKGPAEFDLFKSPTLLGRLLNGTNAMADHFLTRGAVALVERVVTAPNGETYTTRDHVVVGRSLEEILIPLADDMDLAAAYMTAKRTLERYSRHLIQAQRRASQLNAKWKEPGRFQAHQINKAGDVRIYDSKTGNYVGRTYEMMNLPFRMDDAKAVIAEVAKNPEKQRLFDGALSDIQTFRQHLLQYMVANGAISQETMDRIIAGSAHYVPFRPIPRRRKFGHGIINMLKGQNRTEGDKINTHRVGYVPPGVYRQKGDSGPIMNPLDALYNDTYEMIAVAHRARTARALHGLAQKHGAGVIMERVATPVERTPLPVAEALRQLKRLVPEDTYNDLVDIFGQNPQVLNEMLWAFKRGDFHGEPGMVSFVDEGGNRHWYEIHDQDIYEAVMGIEQGSHWFLRMLYPAFFARTLRLGATLAPSFSIMRNPYRDVIMSFVQSESGLKSFGPFGSMDHVRALFHIFRGARQGEDPVWDAFLRGLGEFGSLLEMDRVSLQRQRAHMGSKFMGRGAIRTDPRSVEFMGREFKVPLGFVVRDAVDQLRMLSTLMENMSRVAEFQRALKQYQEMGYGSADAEMLAGALAREVTTDFRRHGSATYAIRMGSAFWNAGLQGWDRTARAFQKDPKGTFIKAVAAITVPSILLWLLNHDDDDYNELPQWMRDFYWLIPLPFDADNLPDWVRSDYDPNLMVEIGAPVAGQGRKMWWKIPKPFGMGLIFGTLPERAMGMIFDNDDTGMARAMKDTMLREFENLIPTPTAWTPIVEAMTNYQLYFHRPIVPRELEGVAPEDQWVANSSELSKTVGDWLNVSPAKIDNLLYGWGGTLLRDGIRVSDEMLDALGAVDRPTAGQLRAERIPLVRDMFATNTQWTGESVSRFYEVYRRPAEVAATAALRERRMIAGWITPDEYVDYITKNRDIMSKATLYETTYQMLQATDEIRDMIQGAKGLSEAQKNARIWNLADTRTRLARAALGSQ